MLSSPANLVLVCCSPLSKSYSHHYLKTINLLGKSCFLHFTLLYWLCNKKPMVFQLLAHHLFITFEESGVALYDTSIPTPDVIPEGSWALTDTDDLDLDHPIPCIAFLMACGLQRACIIQASSPNESLYQPWTKKRIVIEYVMDFFLKAELITLGWVKSP